MLSSRLKNWNTMPMCLRRMRARSSSLRPVISSPAIVIVPSSATSRPAMRLSSVDLPQPDGPMTATNSPAAMSRSTPRRARTGASSASKVLRTPRTEHTLSISHFRSVVLMRRRSPAGTRLTGVSRPLTNSASSAHDVGLLVAARPVSRPRAPCPGGRARSCSRCARFTVSPTTVYSSRSSDPRSAAATSPVDSPMPRPNSGRPSARQRSLTASWRSCIAHAAAQRLRRRGRPAGTARRTPPSPRRRRTA